MFDSKDLLFNFLAEYGVNKVLIKCLAENDNNKQQIYFGGSFEALSQIPYGNVYADNIDGAMPNYKALLDFYWVNDEGRIEKAPKTQLILYPKYPEVRLSGFLDKCSIAPRHYLYPVPRDKRRFNNGKDGRVLTLGICNDGRVLAYLALPETPLARELMFLADDSKVFTPIEITEIVASKEELLDAIYEIQQRGWIQACRMNALGEIVRYRAINGGGYTLEACLGIIPNGRAEPDWRGWELKAYTGNRITLMTPEPNAGFYGEYRVAEFLHKYGYRKSDDVTYFTGIHRCGYTNPTTQMKIVLDDIENVTGGLTLLDQHGEPAAVWTFAKLLEHWGRKHAHTAYIPYKRNTENEYKYNNPVIIGSGTDFKKFLDAFSRGAIFLDPAPKLFINERGNFQTKARNQFRMKTSDLRVLYYQYDEVYTS